MGNELAIVRMTREARRRALDVLMEMVREKELGLGDELRGVLYRLAEEAQDQEEYGSLLDEVNGLG
jgi:hypothetical protein